MYFLTHLLQYSGVDHLGHLLVKFGHLTWIYVLVEVASLEESLNTTHLLDHLAELTVLRQQFVNLKL